MKILEVQSTEIGIGDSIPAATLAEMKKKLLEQLDPTLSPGEKAQAIAKMETYFASLKGTPALRVSLESIEQTTQAAMRRLLSLPSAIEALAMALGHLDHRATGSLIFRLGGAHAQIAQALAALDVAASDFQHILTCSAFPGSVEREPSGETAPEKSETDN